MRFTPLILLPLALAAPTKQERGAAVVAHVLEKREPQLLGGILSNIGGIFGGGQQNTAAGNQNTAAPTAGGTVPTVGGGSNVPTVGGGSNVPTVGGNANPGTPTTGRQVMPTNADGYAEYPGVNTSPPNPGFAGLGDDSNAAGLFTGGFGLFDTVSHSLSDLLGAGGANNGNVLSGITNIFNGNADPNTGVGSSLQNLDPNGNQIANTIGSILPGGSGGNLFTELLSTLGLGGASGDAASGDSGSNSGGGLFTNGALSNVLKGFNGDGTNVSSVLNQAGISQPEQGSTGSGNIVSTLLQSFQNTLGGAVGGTQSA